MLAAYTAAFLLAVCALGGSTPARRNVLYFVVDDLRPEFLAAYVCAECCVG